MIDAQVSGWIQMLSKWTPGRKRPGCIRSKAKGAWIFALVWSFCILPFPASACGYCGSFTTLAPLWKITLLAFPAFLLAAIAQKYLLKETLWPRLAGLFVIFYVFIYGSVDLAWILLSFACLYEIVAHLIKASKKDRTLIRVAFTILFLCYPIPVVYNIYHTQQTEGIVFYPKYSDPQVRSKVAAVKSRFKEVHVKWEPGSATDEKVILPEIESILDPFSIYKHPMAYVIDASGSAALLISRGPNLEFDLNLDSIPWEALEQDPEPFQYDPTNGTASEGDLFIYLR